MTSGVLDEGPAVFWTEYRQPPFRPCRIVMGDEPVEPERVTASGTLLRHDPRTGSVSVRRDGTGELIVLERGRWRRQP